MSILERLTSVFAPDTCLVCGREGWLLCPACRPCLAALKGYCFGCYQKTSGAGCSACLARAGITKLTVATPYEAVAKLLVGCLKFKGNQSAAAIMAQQLLAITNLPSNALLVHMPATAAHVRERGFDQAQLITRHVSRASGLPRRSLLRRHGAQHQLGASREQRLQQLRAALYVARPAAIRGRHIILVDDVLTTGSSLTAAAAVLRAAGAKRVDALAFAQAIK